MSAPGPRPGDPRPCDAGTRRAASSVKALVTVRSHVDTRRCATCTYCRKCPNASRPSSHIGRPLFEPPPPIFDDARLYVVHLAGASRPQETPKRRTVLTHFADSAEVAVVRRYVISRQPRRLVWGKMESSGTGGALGRRVAGAWRSLVSARALGARGRRFESARPDHSLRSMPYLRTRRSQRNALASPFGYVLTVPLGL